MRLMSRLLIVCGIAWFACAAGLAEAKAPIKDLKDFFDQVKAAHMAKNWKQKAALTQSSLPMLKDWDAVLTKAGLKRFRSAKITKDLKRFAGSIKRLARLYRVKPKQSAYLINQASTAKLRSGKHSLPGGMNRIAVYLKPGVVWVRFKFVEPGQRLGMAYTAFAHVNGRWVFFPKPWRYIDTK